MGQNAYAVRFQVVLHVPIFFSSSTSVIGLLTEFKPSELVSGSSRVVEKKFWKQFIQEIGSKPFISKCGWAKWHKNSFWRRVIAVAKVLFFHVLEASDS